MCLLAIRNERIKTSDALLIPYFIIMTYLLFFFLTWKLSVTGILTFEIVELQKKEKYCQIQHEILFGNK